MRAWRCARVTPPPACGVGALRRRARGAPARRPDMPPEPSCFGVRPAPPRPRLLPSTQTALLAMIADAAPHPFTPAADALVVSDARASAEERVQVYAYMYRAR